MIKLVFTDLKTVWTHFRKNGLRETFRLINSREAPGFVQFCKYGTCGVLATVVQLGVAVAIGATEWFPAFEGLVGRDIPDDIREYNLKICNLIAFPFSNLAAYYLNTLWVFTPGRHSKWKEFWLFTLISGISFGAGLFGGPELIGWFGIPSWAAQLGFVITSALVNFVCRKFLIFLK
ncbi:MAG: GtrA family protein [Verrucomicrobiales bacterium]|nr:GtrA family protein [Verrucomicrobiales bacterium]